MNKLRKILPVVMAAAFLFTSCWDNGEEDKDPYVILVYMAADNNLDEEVDYSLEQLGMGLAKTTGRVVVYLDREGKAPRLFELSDGGAQIPLKDYVEENSADAATLARVIRETKAFIPSEKFGLIIWGHSMAWVPQGFDARSLATTFRLGQNIPRLRYTALDSGSGTQQAMEIDDLADALPASVAEFILFDVCLMGSVEALYEIRHTCNYAIAAPTEVLANSEYDASGMPYSKVLPYLFGDKNDLKKACELYYTHYRDLDISGVSFDDPRYTPEMLRSATISLIDMKQLDGLYSVSSGILNGKLSQAAALSVSGMQKYHTDNAAQVFFDMGDVMQSLATTSQYQAFQTQLSKTVLYKAATDKFVTITIDPAHFSGLSMYVPLSAWSTYDEYNYYFNSLSWAGVY